MTTRLETKLKLRTRSDRVKCVDQHQIEPWVLCSLFNGDISIWNYETEALIKRIKVCNLPVRAAKFIPRKNWVIAGSDDMQIRVFNYQTLENVIAFEAHTDYLRYIVVHPTQPCFLTSSDDLLIKMWDWERDWTCQRVFEGHKHFVMQIVINPKDHNTFASASLDATIKVWHLSSSNPNFTLKGHVKGVNCVDYYHCNGKPYLISGAEDCLVKIWDCYSKNCIQTLKNHTKSVSAVCCHPELPLFFTGSEDGTLKFWCVATYRLKSSVNYGLERVWAISAVHGSNNIAIGYDEGAIMLKIGREEPAISMDATSGKITWAKNSEIQQFNIHTLPEGMDLKDGERLLVIAKDLGVSEIFPQTLAYDHTGRFVALCGDGEYTICTSVAFRNKDFGNADEFVWGYESSYATLKNSSIKVFRNFKERKSFTPEFVVDSIFGGYLLGVKSNSENIISFYDWTQLVLIRRIEIKPKSVFWSDSGNLVCLASEEAFFVLKYNQKIVDNARDTTTITENGITDAFEIVDEVNENIHNGLWLGDCFIYTNTLNKLNYYIGGEIVNISHLDRTMYVLGYKDSRVFVNDKELNIISYSLPLSVLEYQTLVMRGEMEAADRLLHTIPHDNRTRLARFLEKQGFLSLALNVSLDLEHKFELALLLPDLECARHLAEKLAESEPSRSMDRWSRLGTVALTAADTNLSKICYLNAKDFSSLFLLACSTGDKALLREVGSLAEDAGEDNIAFIAYFEMNQPDVCLQMLRKRNKLPEAAFFARAYLPSKIGEVVQQWREFLSGSKIGQVIADSDNYENLFPEMQDSLKSERFQSKYEHPHASLEY